MRVLGGGGDTHGSVLPETKRFVQPQALVFFWLKVESVLRHNRRSQMSVGPITCLIPPPLLSLQGRNMLIYIIVKFEEKIDTSCLFIIKL